MLVLICTALFTGVNVRAQDSHVIKVMTYNILHGAAPGLKNSANKVDLEAVAKVIRSQDPDIVALQEVDSMWSRSNNQFQPEVLAEKTGMKYYYYSDSRSFTDTAGWGYGIAILSKYPIKDQHTLFLPYYYHPGSENWVNSIVTVEFPGGKELKFVCAHFDYLYEDNRLLEAMATNDIATHSNIPVILAGDLNSRPGSAPINELKKEFVQTCKICDPTFPSDRPRVKLDYILYSKSSPFEYKSEQVINNADTKFASDHFPYVVELVWK
ncbi:MAG: endonuclease/exonuclease/phosphatase family protein [Acidobacterium ailaaui]|nr:endonuclease/exonuclease/phosphatase family protein [Pseudacidobacterium ailaaui]